ARTPARRRRNTGYRCRPAARRRSPMASSIRGEWLVALACACGAHVAAPSKTAANDEVTLYRDWAVIQQRVALQLPAGASVAKLPVATGVAPDQVAIVDRGGLAVATVHGETPPAPPADVVPDGD